MKLGCQYKSHKGRVAIRHYANQPFNQEKALEGAFSVIVKLFAHYKYCWYHMYTTTQWGYFVKAYHDRTALLCRGVHCGLAGSAELQHIPDDLRVPDSLHTPQTRPHTSLLQLFASLVFTSNCIHFILVSSFLVNVFSNIWCYMLLKETWNVKQPQEVVLWFTTQIGCSLKHVYCFKNLFISLSSILKHILMYNS